MPFLVKHYNNEKTIEVTNKQSIVFLLFFQKTIRDSACDAFNISKDVFILFIYIVFSSICINF